MIDLYQMASLAGISGSWLTDGEMLWLRPLSNPSRERERTGYADEAVENGGDRLMGSKWGWMYRSGWEW